MLRHITQFMAILCIPCSFPSPFPVPALCGAAMTISKLRRVQQHREPTAKITRSVQLEGEFTKAAEPSEGVDFSLLDLPGEFEEKDEAGGSETCFLF